VRLKVATFQMIFNEKPQALPTVETALSRLDFDNGPT
jgi:hypothetical protein